MSLFCDDGTIELIKTKFCKKCNRDLPTTNFGKACGGNYLYSECRECSRKLSKIRKKLREDNTLSDPENYHCPICERSHKETVGSGGARLKNAWVMDHDHSTGEYRGYICHTCNRGLGMFQDSIDILNNAIRYLKK
jgi:hypothetical protein